METFNNAKKPIIYFGRLTESKGIEITIKAAFIIFTTHKDFACPLWIIGGNNEEIKRIKDSEDVRDIIKELELNNLLFWWGHLPHEILPFILRKCSIFCFTSKYEPGGRTILEAMASKLVVLATPHGFAEEVIKNGVNGYIITNDSPVEWANVIFMVLSDHSISHQIAEAAFLTVKDRYSMQSFNTKHGNIYELATLKYSNLYQKD